MKSSTVLRLSLLIPYLLWGIAAIIVRLIIPSINASIESGKGINAIALPSLIYAYGIILWGIPYTLLALGLWAWSRGKEAQRIIRVFACSPFMLAILLSIMMLVISIDWNNMGAGFSHLSLDFGMTVAAIAGLALVYGYFCIGVTVGIYKVLKMLKIIKNEEATQILINENPN